MSRARQVRIRSPLTYRLYYSQNFWGCFLCCSVLCVFLVLLSLFLVFGCCLCCVLLSVLCLALFLPFSLLCSVLALALLGVLFGLVVRCCPCSFCLLRRGFRRFLRGPCVLRFVRSPLSLPLFLSVPVFRCCFGSFRFLFARVVEPANKKITLRKQKPKTAALSTTKYYGIKQKSTKQINLKSMM